MIKSFNGEFDDHSGIQKIEHTTKYHYVHGSCLIVEQLIAGSKANKQQSLE